MGLSIFFIVDHSIVYLCLVAQLCPTLRDPMASSLPGSSMELFRQEYWSRLPFPPPGDLPDSGIKRASLAFPALASGFFPTVLPGKLNHNNILNF